MSDFIIGGNTITIEHVGEEHNPDEGFPRQQYRANIALPDGDFSNDKVLGPQGEPVSIPKVAQSVFAWLYNLGCGKDTGVVGYPLSLAGWALKNRDELKAATLALEYLNLDAPRNGAPVADAFRDDEPDEDLFGEE